MEKKHKKILIISSIVAVALIGGGIAYGVYASKNEGGKGSVKSRGGIKVVHDPVKATQGRG